MFGNIKGIGIQALQQEQQQFSSTQFQNFNNIVSTELDELKRLPETAPYLSNPEIVSHMVWLMNKRGKEGLLKAIAHADPVYPMSLIFNDPDYQKNEDELKVEKERLRNIPDVVKSELFKCKGCGSNKVRVEQKQLRRADEAASTIITCVGCGKHRREG